MRERKNALLLFSKLPKPGLVKTRLSTLKDGAFTPEVAAALYHCMLFDVVEIGCGALSDLGGRPPVEGDEVRDSYNLIISTSPAADVDPMRRLFDEAGMWPCNLTFISDDGASTDEHYDHAFAQAFDAGYDAVLSMGADMPALTKANVIGGFEALHRLDSLEGGGIVLAPDQEMGVSMIGWTRDTDFDHSGTFSNPDGLAVLPAYIAKARERGLPALYLPPVPGVDTMGDLVHTITLVEALCYCAQYDDAAPPWRTADALRQMGWDEVRVPSEGLHDQQEMVDEVV